MILQPKISIITPNLNNARYIEQTIDSVLSQNYSNMEYIICDGGSKDGSKEIISRHEKHLQWWYSYPDGGQADAINRGLKRASGEIVAYLNSDDIYMEGTFQYIADCYRCYNGPKWMVGSTRYVDAGNNVTKTWHPKKIYDLQEWVTCNAGLPQASVFWARDVTEQIGDFRQDLHYCFDEEYWIRMLWNGYKYRLIDKVLSQRLLHEDCKTMRCPEGFLIERDNIYSSVIMGYNGSERKRILKISKMRQTREMCSCAVTMARRSDYRKAASILLKALRSSPIYFTHEVFSYFVEKVRH